MDDDKSQLMSTGQVTLSVWFIASFKVGVSGINMGYKELAFGVHFSHVHLHASSPHILVLISCSFLGFISYLLESKFLTNVLDFLLILFN